MTRRFYRGVDKIDWLVGVLLQNFSDMGGFLVIVGTLIVAFAVVFYLLYATHPCVEDQSACFNDIINADDFDDTAKGLVSPQQALLTMFNAGLFGVFSVAGLDDTASPELATFLFSFYLVGITVVALNALIAIRACGCVFALFACSLSLSL